MSDDIKKVFESPNVSPSTTDKAKPNKAIFLTVIGAFLVFGILIFNPFCGPKKKPKAMFNDQGTIEQPVAFNPALQAPLSTHSSMVTQGGVEERMNAQQMDLEEMRKSVATMQKDQQDMYSELNKKVDALHSTNGPGGGGPSAMYRTSGPDERFTPEYQGKVNHFKQNRLNFWELEAGKYAQLTSVKVPLRVNTDSADDSEAPIQVQAFNYVIPAGSRIIAITEQPVNSDHPGYFTSRIVRPEILKGATLICQNGPEQNERIPVAVTKIVLNNTEYQVSGQVEMGFPGMSGSVNRHFAGKILPVMANAAISGGFVAWSASNQNSTRIDTRDAITGAVVEQTLPQIQNEITKFSVDRPNTVEVASGAQFSVLLTEKLNVRS